MVKRLNRKIARPHGAVRYHERYADVLSSFCKRRQQARVLCSSVTSLQPSLPAVLQEARQWRALPQVSFSAMRGAGQGTRLSGVQARRYSGTRFLRRCDMSSPVCSVIGGALGARC